MSVNNVFSFQRFLLLFKQHLIQNGRIMIFSMIAFCGTVFVVLSLAQLDNNNPWSVEEFLGFMIAFVAIFGIIFVGHSFPAFRSKENTTTYLVLPASQLEKFLFEFIYRFTAALVLLPILYWLTYHLAGYFVQLFIPNNFSAVGFSDIIAAPSGDIEEYAWLPIMIIGFSLLAFTIPFAGAAHFAKQPLIKTLFTIGVVILFFIGFGYVSIVGLDLEKYHPNSSLVLLPSDEHSAFRLFGIASVLANLFMIVIAFLKLKEKEV